MYNTIADNLDEGVIVKNTVAGLHYFNRKGMDFLIAAAALCQVDDTSLTSLFDRIQNFMEIVLTQEQRDLQTKILDSKIFRAWTNSSSNREIPEVVYSFQDFFTEDN